MSKENYLYSLEIRKAKFHFQNVFDKKNPNLDVVIIPFRDNNYWF